MVPKRVFEEQKGRRKAKKVNLRKENYKTLRFEEKAYLPFRS